MKKVSPGDPLRISAETFNTFVDAARAYREKAAGGQGPVLARGNRSSILPAANITGEFCDSFGIAAITGPVLNPATDLPGFMERTALLSHLPEVPADDGQFVIFLEPVPDGDMGMAVVAGVVPVQIDVVNAAHKYADVKHEDVSELQSRLVGAAEILWKESGTGTKWALVRLGGAVPANGFWAKIGEKAADGDNKWKYPWAEQEKTVAGYGGWTDLSGGRSGTTEADPARNTVEDMNTGVGADRQGNGVILEHLDTAEYTFTIQPCPDGVVIWMREVPGPDGTTEYWFQYANGVDGTCV